MALTKRTALLLTRRSWFRFICLLALIGHSAKADYMYHFTYDSPLADMPFMAINWSFMSATLLDQTTTIDAGDLLTSSAEVYPIPGQTGGLQVCQVESVTIMNPEAPPSPVPSGNGAMTSLSGPGACSFPFSLRDFVNVDTLTNVANTSLTQPGTYYPISYGPGVTTLVIAQVPEPSAVVEGLFDMCLLIFLIWETKRLGLLCR